MLFSALDVSEFNRVKSLTNTNEIWKKLKEIHEGTSSVKETSCMCSMASLVNLPWRKMRV